MQQEKRLYRALIEELLNTEDLDGIFNDLDEGIFTEDLLSSFKVIAGITKEAVLGSNWKEFTFSEPNKPLKARVNAAITSAVFVLILSVAAAYAMSLAMTLRSKRNKEWEVKIKDITGRGYKIYANKSKGINACATIGGRITVFKGLSDKLSEREIMAVVLHEVGHHQARDLAKGLAMVTGHATLATLIGLNVIPMIVVETLAAIFYYTRTNVAKEFAADSFAKRYGYGKEMASALKKLKGAQKKPSIFAKAMTSISTLGGLIKTHPETEKRISALLKRPKVQAAMRGKGVPKGLKKT
ncbi:MAG: M48 family metalloprotease [Candidatus Thorarchaeota archaeon]|jgi:Zn-dependent protease with chaperone function